MGVESIPKLAHGESLLRQISFFEGRRDNLVEIPMEVRQWERVRICSREETARIPCETTPSRSLRETELHQCTVADVSHRQIIQFVFDVVWHLVAGERE